MSTLPDEPKLQKEYEMYSVYVKIRNGYFRRILITNDVFYANDVAINTKDAHIETR